LNHMKTATQKRQRTCVTCAQKVQREQLVRIVCDESGSVVIDIKGKMPGRGAYVCSEKCLEAALSSGRLGRALKEKIAGEKHEYIISDFRDAMCI
jgi:predicted RNA-binding protein YlxR (DUF448 family)